MLDALKRKLGFTPTKEETTMEDQTQAAKLAVELNVAELPEMVAVTQELATLQASFADLQTQHATSQEQLTAALAELAGAKEAMTALEAAKAEAENTIATMKMAARKEKVEARIGTVKAEAVLKATEGLADAAFDAVVDAMAMSIDAEAKSAAFKDVGVEAKAKAPEVSEEKTPEMKMIEEKYGDQNA